MGAHPRLLGRERRVPQKSTLTTQRSATPNRTPVVANPIDRLSPSARMCRKLHRIMIQILFVPAQQHPQRQTLTFLNARQYEDSAANLASSRPASTTRNGVVFRMLSTRRCPKMPLAPVTGTLSGDTSVLLWRTRVDVRPKAARQEPGPGRFGRLANEGRARSRKPMSANRVQTDAQIALFVGE